ncbi:MAG TPA: efflux RND transporter periplasmic adaptor subunit [Elusimicrobiales bacterium]|nr:efflux RND transporter periplasmic adaptor subunit [Elusimicrobiales bacterium]
MKKVIAAVLLVSAAAAAYWFFHGKKAPDGPSFIPVTAARGEITDVVDTTGSVAPLNRVVVKPAVAGRVDQLLVEEGDKVKSGQILAYLSSTDRVAILDAARAKGEGTLAKWENTYKPTPVLSPLDGTVIKRGVVKGQTLDTTTEMFALSDDLIVVAQVDESDIGRIKAGQRAIITLDAYPKSETPGAVFQILREGVTVSNVITYSVKIRPDRAPSYFASEMSANIKVIVSRKPNAVLLPATALTDKEDGTRCVYKGSPENPALSPVKTGLDDGTNVEILSGVAAGETIFVPANGDNPQQAAADSANPFMPSGPKKTTTKSGKTSSDMGPPPM